MTDAERRALGAALAALDAAAEQLRIILAEPIEASDTFAAPEVELLEVGEAAQRLSVSKETIRRWLRQDPELGITIGGRHRVNLPALLRRRVT